MTNGLAKEAAGSPQLMQALCLRVCYEKKIKDGQEQLVNIRPRLEMIEKVCLITANMTDYSSIVDKMKDGLRLRDQNRTSYIRKDDSISDVYQLILKAIAVDPPKLIIRPNDLIQRIALICKKKVPSASSISAACAHIEKIANDADNRIIIEWDSEEDVLDIRDPYLLFYLRWAEK